VAIELGRFLAGAVPTSLLVHHHELTTFFPNFLPTRSICSA